MCLFCFTWSDRWVGSENNILRKKDFFLALQKINVEKHSGVTAKLRLTVKTQSDAVQERSQLHLLGL